MKQLIFILTVSVSLLSCAPSSDKTKKESLAIAKRYMEAVETKNYAVMDSLLADNYKGYGPSVGHSINKADALAYWKYNADNLYDSVIYTQYQNIAVTIPEEEAAEAGDWVANWAYLTLKYKDGRGPVHVWVNSVYRIENGKIVHSRTFYNEADVLYQLGYTLQKVTP
jgi:hypothetical protein